MNGIEAYQVELTSSASELERVRDQFIYFDRAKAEDRRQRLAVKYAPHYTCKVKTVWVKTERVA